MEFLIKINKLFFSFLLIASVLALSFYPDVVEASRGGSRGGTLWWIPIVIIGGIIFSINKSIPDLWGIIVVHVALLFVACLGAIFLKWVGFITQEDILITIPIIFVLIIIGLRTSHKSKQNASKSGDKNT